VIGDSDDNVNTDDVVSFLRNVAAILNLKVEQVGLCHDHAGKVEVAAFKLHLGEGRVIGTLVKGDPGYASVYAPIFSSHEVDDTLTFVDRLWVSQGVTGLEIVGEISSSRDDLTKCKITKIVHVDDLVIGNEFANDFKRIAERVVRFEKAGFKRNVMLLGPPGCGKTSIAKQIARHTGRFTINVDSSLLGNIFITRILVHLFRSAILICDDFDRYRGDTQALLASLEKTGSSLIVTCNTLGGFDKATVRVGRMDEIIEVPVPDNVMRERLFCHFNLEGKVPDDDVMAEIIRLTDGFTPAEMREVVKCYRALDADDFRLEVERIRKQAKLADSLSYHAGGALVDAK
jgi:hypothetical protein